MPEFKDGKRSLTFHTVEEYDASLERIRSQDGYAWDDVELQDERCDADFAEAETGWKQRSLDVSLGEVPVVARSSVKSNSCYYIPTLRCSGPILQSIQEMYIKISMRPP